MEFLTILLSGLLGIISPAGLIIDRTAEKTIRSQFDTVEELEVRVDNAPTHQLLQGKIDKIRIAGRSLKLKKQDINIALLELETDRIELEPFIFNKKRPQVQQPIQGGLKLILTQQDINKFLRSPQFSSWLEQLSGKSINFHKKSSNSGYIFTNPKVNFLTGNRLLFQVELQEKAEDKPLLIKVESAVSISAGRKIQLINPIVAVNGEQAPSQFVNQFVNNFNQRLDLDNLQGDGLQVRILKWEMKAQTLLIAAFFRIQPSSRLLETPRSSVSSSSRFLLTQSYLKP
ncbi:MAG: DUF2993 domain-containing protein [Nostocaceae cyanobacterium]|nr:DUF2993 domain-containing protein [Nostocaceae cyanobacterium]